MLRLIPQFHNWAEAPKKGNININVQSV